MARKDIHPETYRELDIVIYHKDGSKETIKTRSTYKGEKLVSEVDLSKHMAWADTTKVDAKSSVNAVMQKFNSRLEKTKQK